MRAIGFFESIWHETMRISSDFFLRDFGMKLFGTHLFIFVGDSGMKLCGSNLRAIGYLRAQKKSDLDLQGW